MKSRRPKLFYDEDDYRLLEIVNRILSHGKNPPMLRRLFESGLHPRGIKELAAPKSLRIASAMIDLLGTLEKGSPEDRLTALRAVRAEVLHDSSQELRLNVARVLLQIMKEIVRAHDDVAQQLALAHDFQEAASGKPRLIRRQLRKFHLLEMPEEWNQLAFDHHVHDANTKGRKTPTHLIMDAWIKGIRFLGVVYYNFVRPEAAAELLEAADIMGIDVRIGVEVAARFRDRYVHLVWAPRGFLGRKDFISFLEKTEVQTFMDRGRAVAEYQQRHILDLLRSFNRHHLPGINEQYGLSVPALDENEFLAFVGTGQASLVHLAEFVHETILLHLRHRVEEMSSGFSKADEKARAGMQDTVNAYNNIVPELLVENYLRPNVHLEVRDLSVPVDEADVPELLQLGPSELLAMLDRLPCRSRITLNPSNLSAADVLEVLYEGEGRITHIEIYNLKDWAQGRIEHRSRINEMRLIINSGNVVEAKRMVRDIIGSVEAENPSNGDDRTIRLRGILWNLRRLLDFYSHSRLRSRLGSDSIGHSRHTRGMGLVVVQTLPLRARLQIYRNPQCQIPVRTTLRRHTMAVMNRKEVRTFDPTTMEGEPNISLLRPAQARRVTWSVGHNSTTLAGRGNIATLGGIPEETGNGLELRTGTDASSSSARPSWKHLNTGVMNIVKIAVGFLPAFFTFYFTKDWWLLAYFGAVIWFGITGLRNILQSVLGGGGVIRSSLLPWSDLVSWSRVADSLLFTGFSVPLLELLVKDLLLARTFDVTTATNPLLLYSVIALANGIYISSHNAYRGLPMGAVVGNFFRTVLSIPLALGINFVILRIALGLGISSEAALAGMQLWAAVISKASSDIVAAVIEGYADRKHNLTHRTVDYMEKLEQVNDLYGRLEAAFPESDVLEMLERSKEAAKTLREKADLLFKLMVINSLDLLYLWMYQPRAQTALRSLMQNMSGEEKRFLLSSQQVLSQKRIISEMLLGGLVGKRFEKALAFYLSQSDRYLKAFSRVAA
jgi:hypothetical protein